jgi:hypothetical protein
MVTSTPRQRQKPPVNAPLTPTSSPTATSRQPVNTPRAIPPHPPENNSTSSRLGARRSGAAALRSACACAATEGLSHNQTSPPPAKEVDHSLASKLGLPHSRRSRASPRRQPGSRPRRPARRRSAGDNIYASSTSSTLAEDRSSTRPWLPAVGVVTPGITPLCHHRDLCRCNKGFSQMGR